MSERSVPQLSLTSTVIVLKFSPVIEFSATLLSQFFLGYFLVSSLSVCDGGMLEFLLVFLVVFSSKMAIRISNKRINPSIILSASLVLLPSFHIEVMSVLMTSNLSRKEALFTVAINQACPSSGVRYLEKRIAFGSRFSAVKSSPSFRQ